MNVHEYIYKVLKVCQLGTNDCKMPLIKALPRGYSSDKKKGFFLVKCQAGHYCNLTLNMELIEKINYGGGSPDVGV
jgi:hypothetical protein